MQSKEDIERKQKEEVEIDLPIVKISEGEIYEALLVHTPYNESFKDGILKLETWIMNFAEEQIAPLRDSAQFSEEEIEDLKKKMCVISPITLTLYLHWLQMETFLKLPDSEKEKCLLEKIPDRFKARFKGNASNRQAREVSAEEEKQAEDISNGGSIEEMKRRQSMTFLEFLKEFGKEVKASINTNDEGKAA